VFAVAAFEVDLTDDVLVDAVEVLGMDRYAVLVLLVSYGDDAETESAHLALPRHGHRRNPRLAKIIGKC
jgi:hypothetical protein